MESEKLQIKNMEAFSNVIAKLRELINGQEWTKEEQEKEVQRRRMRANFFHKEENIKIPEKFKEIVIRTNAGNISPLYEIEWPNKGSVYSLGERGLFGVRMFQNLYYILSCSYIYPEPTYMILEVDKRNIETLNDWECEFKECNIIYSGGLNSFLDKLKENITVDQYTRIKDSLDWKVQELSECKTIDQMKTYMMKTKQRYNIFTSPLVDLHGIFLNIAINLIKENQKCKI